IAGAGTIGLEVIQEIPDLDAIIVPVGGAGLIAGISLAVKTLRPDVLVIGVEPENCPSLTMALRTDHKLTLTEAGHPTVVNAVPTLADGLAVAEVGDISFKICQKHVDHVVTVSEHYVALSVLRFVETVSYSLLTP
ncbi:MAG TPA: pyridoxal-phosphate dependent enzyme, partial [Candidatus Obscuribacterales bacterium]